MARSHESHHEAHQDVGFLRPLAKHIFHECTSDRVGLVAHGSDTYCLPPKGYMTPNNEDELPQAAESLQARGNELFSDRYVFGGGGS